MVSGSPLIAEAEAAALAVQRQSDSLISVVAADSGDRLPDESIALAVVGAERHADDGLRRSTNDGLTVSGWASGYAYTCTCNLPDAGTVYGIDIRPRATLSA